MRSASAGGMLRWGSAGLGYSVRFLCGNEKGIGDAQGKISGKMEVMLRKSPGSARVGYDLKVPMMPVRRKRAYSGSCL